MDRYACIAKGTFCPGTHVLSSKVRGTVAGSKMKNAAPLGRGCVVPKAGHSAGSTCEDCRFPVMTCVPAKDAGTVVISAPSLAHAGAADKTATQTADTRFVCLTWSVPCVCAVPQDTAASNFAALHAPCSHWSEATPQHTHASIALARWLLVPLSSGRDRSWCRHLLQRHHLGSRCPGGRRGSPRPRAQGSTLRSQNSGMRHSRSCVPAGAARAHQPRCHSAPGARRRASGQALPFWLLLCNRGGMDGEPKARHPLCACMHPFALLRGHNPPLQSDTEIPPTPDVVLPAGHGVQVVSCRPTSAGLPGLKVPTAQACPRCSTKKQTSEQLRHACATTEPSSRDAQTQPDCMQLLVSLPAAHEPKPRTRHRRPGGHQHVCAALGGESCCRGSTASGTGLPPQCFFEPQGWPPWESTASASVRLSAPDPSAAPAAGSAAACACLLLSPRARRGSVASRSQ